MTHGLTRRSGLLAGAASALSSSWIRTAQGDENGTLSVALSTNPVTCDPINSSSHDWELISETIFENLVEFDINGVLKPQLAKELPTVSVRPTAAEIADAMREDSSFQVAHAISTSHTRVSRSASPTLPSLGLDMPYYSFGKALPRVSKE